MMFTLGRCMVCRSWRVLRYYRRARVFALCRRCLDEGHIPL